MKHFNNSDIEIVREASEIAHQMCVEEGTAKRECGVHFWHGYVMALLDVREKRIVSTKARNLRKKLRRT